MKTHPKVSELLERTKLSNLPSASRAKPFALKTASFSAQPARLTCAGCGGRTDQTNDFQRAVGVCRTCLIIHSRVDNAFISYGTRKAQEWLEKAAEQGGVGLV